MLKMSLFIFCVFQNSTPLNIDHSKVERDWNNLSLPLWVQLIWQKTVMWTRQRWEDERWEAFVATHHITNARWTDFTSSRADGDDPCKFRNHLHKMMLCPARLRLLCCQPSALDVLVPRPSLSLCHITLTHPPPPNPASAPLRSILIFTLLSLMRLLKRGFHGGTGGRNPTRTPRLPGRRWTIVKGEVCGKGGREEWGWGVGLCSSLASSSSAGTLLVKALGGLLPFNLQYFTRLAALCMPAINVRRRLCLRFNKLINNLSCVHRHAEVLGNVTGPAINTRAGYSDGGQMAPVPALPWLNNFPGGTFRARARFCSGSPWVTVFCFCFQPFDKATVRRRSTPLPIYIPQLAFAKHQRDSPVYVLRTGHQSSQSSLLPRLSPRLLPTLPTEAAWLRMLKLMCIILFFTFSLRTAAASL